MEYNGLKRELTDIALLNKQRLIHQGERGKSKQPQRIFAVKTMTDLF